MGIFQLDATILTMVQLGIEDLRKNPWLLDHMLSDFTSNPYLKDKYGQKQVDSCKEWFLANQVDVYMRPRNDKDRMPCVTITPGQAPEEKQNKTMGDTSPDSIVLMPLDIGKPIAYIVKPFTPVGYDISTGIVEIDPATEGLDVVSPGMILVNPENGQGYSIIDITADGVQIGPDIHLDATQLAIVPQYQFYKARIEHSFFREHCEISCYSHGDPQVALWLHSIVMYSLLRYRESLLEGQGFSESMVSSGPLMEDRYYEGPGGEQAFVRSISLSGLSEYTWIKSPRRVIETVALREKTSDGYIGGIKIISNLDSPSSLDLKNEVWYTVEDDE